MRFSEKLDLDKIRFAQLLFNNEFNLSKFTFHIASAEVFKKDSI